MSVFTNPASRSAEQAAAYTRAVLELLGSADPLAVLESTPATARRAIEDALPDRLARPEAPGKWSVRHVLRHFADSEIVWGFRLRMILAHDRPRLAGYDQDAWAERLRYADEEPQESLDEFATLRRSNLRVLRRAGPEALTRVGVHDERGEESIEHLLRLYAGHDILHLNQIDRILAAVP